MRRYVLALAMLMALPLATTACSGTDAAGMPTVYTSGDNTIAAGTTVENDVVLIAETLTIEEGGAVDGDVLVVNGDLSVQGEVTGDIFMVSGDIDVAETASVGGDISNLSGDVSAAEGTVAGATGGINGVPDFEMGTGETPAEQGMGVLLKSIIQALIVMIFAWILPKRVENMRRTLDESVGMAAGYGILTWIVGIFIGVVLIFTFCGIPISIAIFLFLWLGSLFGWTAFGAQVGEWVESKTGKDFSLPVQSGLGAWLLFLLLSLLELIPCFGWIVSIAIRAIALGVAMLSRFGARAYPEPSTE